jgi:Dual specificity phosphatase, catalytic domain
MAEPQRVHPMDTAEDATEILPNLWLGNVRASVDEEFIRKKGIQVVFNCTKNLPFCPLIPTKYRVPVDDNLEEDEIRNMELWAAEITFKMMSEYMAGKPILVHCMAGMQRSAASVAMMLIAYKGIRAHDAMKMIKDRRRIAFFPAPNFLRSIQYFDQFFHGEVAPQLKHLKTE